MNPSSPSDSSGTDAGKKAASTGDSGSANPKGNAPPNGPVEKKLTPEEQMERYEEYLKETDWGHQPC